MITAALSHAEQLLDHVVLSDAPRHVGRLVSHDAGMLEVTGFNRPIGTGARVASSDGGFARAEVVGFRGNRAILVPLDVDAPLENGARVEPDSAANMVQVGEGLIGRVGLDQNAIIRNRDSNRPQVVRLLVRHHPREADVQTKFDTLGGTGSSSRIRMHHTLQRPACSSIA